MTEKNESKNNNIIEKNKNINQINKSSKNNVFQNLYKSIKIEISEKVVNKLLKKVEFLEKENKLLRIENKSLKNHIIHILRKILLNKIEYSNNGNNNKNISRIKTSKNKSFSKTKISNTFLSSTRHKDTRSSCNDNSLNFCIHQKISPTIMFIPNYFSNNEF